MHKKDHVRPQLLTRYYFTTSVTYPYESKAYRFFMGIENHGVMGTGSEVYVQCGSVYEILWEMF